LHVDAGECFLLWVTQLHVTSIKEKIAEMRATSRRKRRLRGFSAKAKHFLRLILPLYTRLVLQWTLTSPQIPDELVLAEMPRRPSASPAGVHGDAKKYRSQKHDDP